MTNGRLGTGLPSLLAAGSVAVISGVEVVMLLRANRPYYEVIGSAYIHGIMQGDE